MTDTQVITVAIAVIVPVSTLLGGIFFQDHRATALRAELVDSVKKIHDDMKEIRDDLREIRRKLA